MARVSRSKAKSAAVEPAAVRSPDADATQKNIIEVATHEFARMGLSGARVDDIAAKTDCSKRMIYYYFVDKEGLYLRVLEEAYRRVRNIESAIDLDSLEPVAALRTLIEFTFDHHHSNEEFIRLVMIENIHHGQYLQQSSVIQNLNAGAISALDRLYQRGLASGDFRAGLSAIDLHWQISALCFFNVSNRATFSRVFHYDMTSPAALNKLRQTASEMILGHVLTVG